jgi:hypothetical protein
MWRLPFQLLCGCSCGGSISSCCCCVGHPWPCIRPKLLLLLALSFLSCSRCYVDDSLVVHCEWEAKWNVASPVVVVAVVVLERVVVESLSLFAVKG